MAGNLQEYVVSGSSSALLVLGVRSASDLSSRSEFRAAQKRLGDDGDLTLSEARSLLHQQQEAFSLFSFLTNPLKELPRVCSMGLYERFTKLIGQHIQVVFTLRAVQSPRSIPVSLASLTLIREAVSLFINPLIALLDQTSSMSETFASIRRLYEMNNVPNQLVDGSEPYPENKQTLSTGIAFEFMWVHFFPGYWESGNVFHFRDVSFKYPGSDHYAIRNVSFKIEAGQLCVLVGFNGSGESSLTKHFLIIKTICRQEYHP